jgi:hypothetical protein
MKGGIMPLHTSNSYTIQIESENSDSVGAQLNGYNAFHNNLFMVRIIFPELRRCKTGEFFKGC